MAGGIDWFRWHHGSVADQKFILIAKKAGASVAEVIAVWACLLEAASASDQRGNFGFVDYEALDCALGMVDGRAQAIHEAMAARGVVTPGGDVSSWEKRQPKRERTDDSSATRTRSYRDRQAAISDATQSQVTPCDATQSQVTPRGEESREEEKTKTARKRAAPAVLVSVSEMVAEGVNEQHATDWLIARKAKDLPLTPTAWDQTKAEAVKAGMTVPDAIKTAAANGWAGFKASWLEQGSTHRGFDPPKTVPSAAADATAAYLAEQAQRGSTAPPKAVLEALKALRVVA